jgi:hypothetical protein
LCSKNMIRIMFLEHNTTLTAIVVELAVRLFFEGRLGAAKAARAEARVQ